ncbi:MAG: hypothetical protein ACXAEB_00090 [Candidatus Thorarchaeota archaeon]
MITPPHFSRKQWFLLIALLISWSITGWTFAGNQFTLIVSIAGFLSIILLAVVLHYSASTPVILWDDDRNLLAVLHSWRVVVSSACLMTSIPLGIDLSHAAKNVLRSMSSRFEDENGGEVRFFIYRPVENESTRVGMMVVRSSLRFFNGITKIDTLSDKVDADAMILESSMRAAYPHTPVQRANQLDTMIATTGGANHFVQIK